jgi:hypothetical protein
MGHIWVNPWPKIWFFVWGLPFLCGANLCLALLLVCWGDNNNPLHMGKDFFGGK